MMIFNQINPLYFFVSLFIGLFFGYVTTPEPTIIIKYPTPYNHNKVTYKDNSGVCYKYRMHKIYCPNDKNKITDVNVQ